MQMLWAACVSCHSVFSTKRAKAADTLDIFEQGEFLEPGVSSEEAANTNDCGRLLRSRAFLQSPSGSHLILPEQGPFLEPAEEKTANEAGEQVMQPKDQAMGPATPTQSFKAEGCISEPTLDSEQMANNDPTAIEATQRQRGRSKGVPLQLLSPDSKAAELQRRKEQKLATSLQWHQTWVKKGVPRRVEGEKHTEPDEMINSKREGDKMKDETASKPKSPDKFVQDKRKGDKIKDETAAKPKSPMQLAHDKFVHDWFLLLILISYLHSVSCLKCTVWNWVRLRGMELPSRLKAPANKIDEKSTVGQRIKKANEAWMLSAERAALIAGRKHVQT